MINHHPSEATLFAHSAGTLPAALRRVVSVHLALCPACRAPVRLSAEVCGAMLEDLPPAEMGSAALSGALARLDLRDLPEPPRKPPSSVAELATGRWRWVAPGVHMMALSPRGDEDARLDLLRARPGVMSPVHGHSGLEFTCVLQGGLHDEGRDYLAGDFSECDGNVTHNPVVLPLGEDCISLIATFGRLQAKERAVRFFHRLLGM